MLLVSTPGASRDLQGRLAFAVCDVMSRYTGPRLRISRRLGVDLPGLTRKTIENRPFPPGQHGSARKRRPSEYAMQLLEKQKLCYNYGVKAGQLLRLFREASASKRVTGERLVELLELRLDNVLFRSGFAPTIPAGRQLVNHGHVRVNGKRVDVPSYRVRTGEVITLRDKVRNLEIVQSNLTAPRLEVPAWLKVSPDKYESQVLGEPGPGAEPFDLDVQLVVEFFNRFT